MKVSIPTPALCLELDQHVRTGVVEMCRRIEENYASSRSRQYVRLMQLNYQLRLLDQLQLIPLSPFQFHYSKIARSASAHNSKTSSGKAHSSGTKTGEGSTVRGFLGVIFPQKRAKKKTRSS